MSRVGTPALIRIAQRFVSVQGLRSIMDSAPLMHELRFLLSRIPFDVVARW